jgi:hypothetical protein
MDYYVYFKFWRILYLKNEMRFFSGDPKKKETLFC